MLQNGQPAFVKKSQSSSFSFQTLPGGVCAPAGFYAAGVSCGVKSGHRRDLALIVSHTPCHGAGVFTINAVKAAPVLLDLRLVRQTKICGIVANSGNANACTGELGMQNARRMSEAAGKALTLRDLKPGKTSFLVCSTGRIGIQLPMKKINRGILDAASRLSRKADTAAEAIMTTDTFSKQASVQLRLGGRTIRIGGMAKGAGMIQPGMSASGQRPMRHATMLCFLTTDAVISRPILRRCLNQAVARSFNRITVDGDMSTNDTVLLLANGGAGNVPPVRGSSDLRRFQAALDHVALTLARMIVKDGEGISKVVTLEVTGAASASDAERAVRAMGNSILVKCSWCGEDPNWGRLLDATGYSGAKVDVSRFSIHYNGIPLVRNGLEVHGNFQKVRQIVRKPSFSIECCLGLGKHRAVLYTTDLTEKYVELNKGE